MSIKALVLSAARDYVSELDTARDRKGAPTEEATVFQLGTLDSRIYGRIKDLATRFKVDTTGNDNDVETAVNVHQVAFETVQYGLRGWRNFRDGDGNDMPFKTVGRNHGGKSYKVVDPALMELIPSAIIQELANEISSDNTVEDVAKPDEGGSTKAKN